MTNILFSFRQSKLTNCGFFSLSPARAILLLTALVTITLPASAVAEEDGRYRAVVLHEGGGTSPQSAGLSPKVFILDSREGHMWTWEQNAWLRDSQGERHFGTSTIYQGKLKAGSRVGEVVEQNR